MFQGNFDEEKAKTFGLQRQALNQLTNQALLLNLALAYDLRVSNSELLENLKTQEYFFKDGVFNKGIYKEALSRNNLTMKEYEADLRKQLTIQKLLKLLPIQENAGEKSILDTVISIADKIEYKVLSDSNITIDTSDAALKPFWESKKHEFMSEVSYNVKYIKQEKVSKEYDDAKISQHYAKNKNHFKDADGKILDLENAKDKVIAELNAKATKEMALRAYIAYKKRKLSEDVQVNTITLSKTNNQFNDDILEKISKLSITSPYLKPVELNGEFFTFELIKINPSKVQSFENAKASVLPLFTQSQKKEKLMQLANDSLQTFKGRTTDFITNKDSMSLSDISLVEAEEFLSQLFNSQKKRGIISVNNGKVILYNILEQKMLNITNNNPANSMTQLKTTLFNEGLIKNLQNEYTTEIFIEGL